MGGLGYSFDAMDGAVIAFVLPVLISIWHLSNFDAGVVASATYIGYFIGALIAGMAGDMIGRRIIMMSALAVFCLASLASAFATTWPVFFGLRTIAGVGIGAESVIIAPFLSEFVASRYRGRFVGALAGFFSFGFLGAAVLGYLLIPASDRGWQLAIIATAMPIVLLLWWRRALPESPRWLEEQGRSEEANVILDRIEREVRNQYGSELPQVETESVATRYLVIQSERRSIAGNLRALRSPALIRITIMTWLLWSSITFSYYSFFTWIPTLLVQSGMTISQSFGYSLGIYAAQIPGYFSAAYLNEVIGRRATIVGYLLVGSASALALAMATSDLHAVIASICLSLFMNGTYAGVYAYTSEVFPTAVRTTGVGLASAVGRLGAICAPVLVGILFPLWGFIGVFGVTTAALLIGALAVLCFGVPTTGKSLESIAADEIENASTDKVLPQALSSAPDAAASRSSTSRI
jgi:putative MFS transporter